MPADDGRKIPKAQKTAACCALCLDGEKSIVKLVPCGHKVYCLSCARSKLMCGICGAAISHEETIKRDRARQLRLEHVPSYLKAEKSFNILDEPEESPRTRGVPVREHRFLEAMQDWDWSKSSLDVPGMDSTLKLTELSDEREAAYRDRRTRIQSKRIEFGLSTEAEIDVTKLKTKIAHEGMRPGSSVNLLLQQTSGAYKQKKIDGVLQACSNARQAEKKAARPKTWAEKKATKSVRPGTAPVAGKSDTLRRLSRNAVVTKQSKVFSELYGGLEFPAPRTEVWSLQPSPPTSPARAKSASLARRGEKKAATDRREETQKAFPALQELRATLNPQSHSRNPNRSGSAKVLQDKAMAAMRVFTSVSLQGATAAADTPLTP